MIQNIKLVENIFKKNGEIVQLVRARDSKLFRDNLIKKRLSYVGELGYELYVKTSDSKNIYEKLIEKGKKYNLSNCGIHVLDTMRMESSIYNYIDKNI